MDTTEGRADRRAREHATTADAVKSAVAIAGHPVYPMLIPIAFLAGALATDVVFLVTGDEFFARMSVWLLGAGAATGALAGVPGAVDFFATARARRSRAGQVHAIGNAVVLGLAVINLALRLLGEIDAAVSPWGVLLSTATGLLLAVTGWAGGELSYRHMIGVDPHPELKVGRRVHRE